MKPPNNDCPKCGFEHQDPDEAEAMHDASSSVVAWFRERVELSLRPVDIGKKTHRALGDNRTAPIVPVGPAKRKGRGYDGPLEAPRGRMGRT
jgi:hypothetical protein